MKIDLRTPAAPTPEPAIPILLIGPRDTTLESLRGILTPPCWEVRETIGYSEIGEIGVIVDTLRIGVAICDAEVTGGDWRTLLADLQCRRNPPNLIVSARLADERLWAEVLNLGGYDVLVQPFDAGEVLRVVRMAWRTWHTNYPVATQSNAGKYLRAAS